MKNRLHLIIFIFVFSITACGLPGSVPATPTRYPLPSTPNLPLSLVATFPVEISTPPSTSSGLASITATASTSLPEEPPSNAIDGNLDTIWNSGADAEQWIQLDLGKPITVSLIRLVISQYPAGETIHQIWVGADSNNLTLLHEFKSFTTEPGTLEFTPTSLLTNVQFVKIVTTQSSSWVAWREIEVIGE